MQSNICVSAIFGLSPAGISQGQEPETVSENKTKCGQESKGNAYEGFIQTRSEACHTLSAGIDQDPLYGSGEYVPSDAGLAA